MKAPGKAASGSALQVSDFNRTVGDAQRAHMVHCKPQSNPVGITCFITVLPIRAVHALKAAGGLSLNNALSGAWEAVPAAVRERYLQEKSPKKVNGSSAPCTAFPQQDLGITPRVLLLDSMLAGEP